MSAIVVAHRVSMRPSARAPLDLCLRSVLAEPTVDELIIVDHANDEAVSSSLRALQADRRDVIVVPARAALSVAAAANLGASQASGRWLLFLDPSVVLQRGAVARLAALNANTEGSWIAGGRLMDMRGRERPLVRAGSLNAFSSIAVALGLRAGKRMRRRATAATRVAAVSGEFMLIPYSDFGRLKGFDEAYATDGADLDLCRRMAEQGGSVLFHPMASGVQFERRRTRRKLVQGLALFASKSARTPAERAFALVAAPALLVAMTLKDLVLGGPPQLR
ncbi:MAG: glycosyltransferase [Hyphomonadaceae bacterium]|nr:glycosyltransferase [Hyphomonadaceae bacterium]